MIFPSPEKGEQMESVFQKEVNNRGIISAPLLDKRIHY